MVLPKKKVNEPPKRKLKEKKKRKQRAYIEKRVKKP